MTTILVRHAAKNLQKNKKATIKRRSGRTRMSYCRTRPGIYLLFADEESAKRVFEAG
jgi:hypothetical protein